MLRVLAKIQEVESEPAPLPSPPGKAEAAPLSARLPRPEPERLVAIGDNASGNFVKVVQRIPVRLVWTDLPDDVRVAAGLSVNVTILTK
jgi:hypothetical protein